MPQRFEPSFYMYGAAPPEGQWAYTVDDFGICYGPGWWPFHRDGKPGTVRVAPDVEYRARPNEYLLISPGQAATATARLHLFIRAQGLGVLTVAAYFLGAHRSHCRASVVADFEFASQPNEHEEQRHGSKRVFRLWPR